jgi:dTDP-4-dehydrorhamnose 3,5-epimerase
VERLPTRLDGPILLAPAKHGDHRGFFQETFRRNAYAELGIREDFVQDNHSRSRRGIIRGMHFQPGMSKLLRVARGAVFDVLVDLRKGSPTFGQWEGIQLDDENLHQLYCPDGFAHGFCVVSDVADLVYKCSDYWDPAAERVFAYDDPDVGIEWPDLELLASERDANAPPFREITDALPYTYAR